MNFIFHLSFSLSFLILLTRELSCIKLFLDAVLQGRSLVTNQVLTVNWLLVSDFDLSPLGSRLATLREPVDVE